MQICVYIVKIISVHTAKGNNLKKNNMTFEDKKQEFFAITKDHSKAEEMALNWFSTQLRAIADHIELKKFPMVFHASFPKDGIKTKGETILDFSISLSHPWGG